MLQATPSRVERRKERTRRALLAVALELFHQKGIYWTKIEDITERADIGKGTFYQHFETKEDLLEVLLAQGLDALLARSHEAAHTSGADSEFLSRIIQAQLDFHLEHKEYLLFFHQVRGLLQLSTDSVRNLRRMYDGYLDQMGVLIEPALNSRDGHAMPAREFAMAISAFTLGLLTHHLLFDGTGESQQHRTDIQSQLERSLHALM